MKTIPSKVLLIDSEMLVHLAVSQAYRDRGPYFISAANAGEALKKMELFDFDLFLLALDQKDAGSLQLLRLIDQRFYDVPVILMANDTTEYSALIEQIEETKKQGTWHLIEKPCSLDILTELIERCLYERAQVGAAQLASAAAGQEKRNSLRSSHVQTVQLYIDASERGYKEEKMVNATLTDVSAGGLGLVTKYPLKKSQSVRFANSSAGQAGVVVWSAQLDSLSCRAGVQFSDSVIVPSTPA